MGPNQRLLKQWIMNHLWNLAMNADEAETHRDYMKLYREVDNLRTPEALTLWIAGWITERDPLDIAEWLVAL